MARVVKQLLEKNRFVCIVIGQPYRPTDQASVERKNREVEKVIDSCLLTEKKENDNPSWADMLPMTTGVLNNFLPSSLQTIPTVTMQPRSTADSEHDT